MLLLMRKWRANQALSLDLLVESMAAKVLVEFFLLHRLNLKLLVAASNVTRRGLALLSGFRAFQYNMFSWHNGCEK